MSGIVGRGTTYGLPNYVGELFNLTPGDTPLLSAIGGLTGGKESNAGIYHRWQTVDSREGEDDRQRLEGQDAPDAAERVRAPASTILEIHQETVDVSYTKQAATQLIAAGDVNHPNGGGGGSNPITDEFNFQVNQAIKSKALDVNTTFINGTFHDPADNTEERRTRGLLEAITTNVVDAADSDTTEDPGTPAWVREVVLDLMQECYDGGGLREGDTRTLMCGSAIKRLLTKAFITDLGGVPADRNVGGANVTRIETDFGFCNIMLEPAMPSGKLASVSLEELAPVFLPIPGKGHFFVEKLAQTGASIRAQLYGEIGLEYGNEQHHGVLDGLLEAGS